MGNPFSVVRSWPSIPLGGKVLDAQRERDGKHPGPPLVTDVDTHLRRSAKGQAVPSGRSRDLDRLLLGLVKGAEIAPVAVLDEELSGADVEVEPGHRNLSPWITHRWLKLISVRFSTYAEGA